MGIAAWTKNADEEILVGKDWTRDLDDATIVDVLDPQVAGDVTCEREGSSGNITRYWLKGGTPLKDSRVTIAIRTSEGELLSERVPVIVQ